MQINNEQERRFGTFRIAGELVRKDIEALAVVMREVVIVRAEYLYADDAIEYTAWSRHFEVLAPYVISPEYEFVLARLDDGSLTVVSVAKRDELISEASEELLAGKERAQS